MELKFFGPKKEPQPDKPVPVNAISAHDRFLGMLRDKGLTVVEKRVNYVDMVLTHETDTTTRVCRIHFEGYVTDDEVEAAVARLTVEFPDLFKEEEAEEGEPDDVA